MANTTNYAWSKPDIAGSNGAWGGILNTDLDSIDSTVKAVSDVANTALANAAIAGSTATTAINLATTNEANLGAKIQVRAIAPTAGDVYPDGTLWCVV